VRKKALWTAVCGLMLLSLVISACGQAATSTQTTQQSQTTQTTQISQTTQTSKTTITTSTPATSDKPKYGGTFASGLISDVTTFAGIENC
jgi:hypothetical protein